MEPLFPFPAESPLGRATRDPIGALALLAEAVSRGEQHIEPYLIAAKAAIAHVEQHGFILLPSDAQMGDVAAVLDKPGHSAPYELYKQTGGGQAYRDAMLAHGYIRELTPEEKAERDRLFRQFEKGEDA